MRLALLGCLLVSAACNRSHPPPAPVTPPAFDKQTLDTAFRAEGVAVFDVDRDGRLDLVTDQYWYAGPTFEPHEIRTPQTYDPASAYSLCMAAFGDDINGDGWNDVIIVPRATNGSMPPVEAVYWYENPRGSNMDWTRHVIAAQTAVETALYVDLFGDGHRELVMGLLPPAQLASLQPGPDPTQPWIATPISAIGFAGAGQYVHGLGVGDVDGDGIIDVLTGYGWFQGSADHTTWRWHAFGFGPDACSTMYAYDVDRDGLSDVLCARPHDYGLHWWQQVPAPPGADLTFVDHLVDDSISQMHAVDLVDLDGDGVPELVTGKRFWAHGPDGDPGAGDPVLLTYYVLRNDPAQGVTFERHDIDAESGIGTQFPVTDVDGDRRPDIVVSNKKGLFVFHQR